MEYKKISDGMKYKRITRYNLLLEYPKYEKYMPKKVRDSYPYVIENLNRYGGRKEITDEIDNFLDSLNEAMLTSIVNPEAKKQPPKKEKSEKPAATPKPKPEPSGIPEDELDELLRELAGGGVTEIPVAVPFIRSYCALHGKVKTKKQIYSFIKKLQNAIAEKRIRKTSDYAKDIRYIQRRLIAFYNDMHCGAKTYEIPAAKLSELKDACDMRWADHVQIIKQYINILNETKTGTKAKAQTILKKIENIEFSADAKTAISDITKSLKDYIDGKTDAPVINEFALQGLRGLAGIDGLGDLPAANAPMSAAEFKNASFNLMGFTGKWLQMIGNPSAPFNMMVWGTGGSGKSTLALEFALYLAQTHDKRVLYIANEEGAGATLHDKMCRTKAFHPNIIIANTLPTRLVEYDFIFCDSANSMQLDLANFKELTKRYPYISWVLMFQTTKDGNFLGTKDWQHAVDVEVFCIDGKAKALKSRFGGSEEVTIF